MSPSLLLAIFSLISRGLGLIEKPLLAAYFGVGAELDAYFAAFRLPDLVFNLMVVGTVTVSFIPLITPLIEKKHKQQAIDFASAVFNWVFLGLGVILAGLWFFIPQIIPLFTENFDAETMALTIKLSRIMMLSPLLFALSAVLGSICNAHHKFLPYALAPVLYKLGILFGIVVLSPKMGIMGVAWGVVIGAVAHFLINIPTLAKLRWRWRPALFIETKKVKTIGKLALPRLISIGASQINLFVDTFLATGIAVGALTIFSFADSVGNIPVGIIGLSIAVASYPLLSSLAHNKDCAELSATLSHKSLLIIFLMLPITIKTIFLAPDIITFLFDWGHFDPADIPIAALVLSAFAISFVPQSLIPLFNRAFYAHQQVKWPMIAALVTLVINIILAFTFVKWLHWNVWALGLAYSLAAFVNCFFLVGTFFTCFQNFTKSFWLSLLKILILNALLIALLWFLLHTDLFGDLSSFPRFVSASVAGFAFYLVIAWGLGLKKIWKKKAS